MTFGEKLRRYRKEKGLTQTELAEKIGTHPNTICNYETGKAYPQSRDTYAQLAKILGVDRQDLYNEDEEFITAASEKYGYRGQAEAKDLLAGFSGLMAGGELSEADKDAVMKALQDIYWACKKDNAEKFSSGKTEKKS